MKEHPVYSQAYEPGYDPYNSVNRAQHFGYWQARPNLSRILAKLGFNSLYGKFLGSRPERSPPR